MKIQSIRIAIFFIWCAVISAKGEQPSQHGIPSAAAPPGQSHVLQVGEELEYSVHYLMFNIGTVRLQVSGKEIRNGRNVFLVHCYIESNPSLSWLKELHVKFYSEIDEDAYSYYWVGEDSSSKGIKYARIKIDYDGHKFLYEAGKKTSTGEYRAERRKVVPLGAGRYQDGLSLFYYAREYVHQQKSEQVQTVMDSLSVSTLIDFQNKEETNEIDAVSKPVNVLYFDGRADFTGVYGLTGGFEGWFSNDDARIPITAKMKVIVGSIRVELIKWKHSGWTPPQGK